MSLLGIDVGTSGCKAALFSEEGQLLSLAYEEYDYQHAQPGWAELDTPRVWEQIKRTIQAAIGDASRDPVQALSISSLGEAVVPVSADRQILGPSLLNFDIRGSEYLPELQSTLSAPDLYRINGNTLGNHYSLTKVKWLKQHQPALYDQAAAFLHWSGFVAFMLGAEPRVDYSLANRTLLFDLERNDWSPALLEITRLDRQKLPPTIPAGSVIGQVERAIACELGIPAGIPIVLGGHDQCCNSLGCGAIGAGQAMYGMGTFVCMTPVFARRPSPDLMLERGLNTEHHVAPGKYVSFLYNQGGSLVKWFRDTFAAAERQSAKYQGRDLYTLLMAEMPEAPSQVMALPHFTVTGPPNYITDSCGVLAGLKLETTRGNILKGILEASTFYIRETFESLPGVGIEVTDFRAVGGGSKSDAWVQLCADILGRPFMRPQVNEAGALGAAILAGVGSDIFPSVEDGVGAMVKDGPVFAPDPTKQRQYDQRFDQYRRLWPLMADYLRELASEPQSK